MPNRRLKRFLADRRGLTTIEYGVLAAAVVVCALFVLQTSGLGPGEALGRALAHLRAAADPDGAGDAARTDAGTGKAATNTAPTPLR